MPIESKKIQSSRLLNFFHERAFILTVLSIALCTSLLAIAFLLDLELAQKIKLAILDASERPIQSIVAFGLLGLSVVMFRYIFRKIKVADSLNTNSEVSNKGANNKNKQRVIAKATRQDRFEGLSMSEVLAIVQTAGIDEKEKDLAIQRFFAAKQVNQAFMQSWGVRAVVALFIFSLLLMGWKIYTIDEIGDQINEKLILIQERADEAVSEINTQQYEIKSLTQETKLDTSKFQLEKERALIELEDIVKIANNTAEQAENRINNAIQEKAAEDYLNIVKPAVKATQEQVLEEATKSLNALRDNKDKEWSMAYLDAIETVKELKSTLTKLVEKTQNPDSPLQTSIKNATEQVGLKQQELETAYQKFESELKNKLQSEPASYIERDQVLREKFSELEKKFDAMEEEILGFQESLEKVTFNTNILEDLNGRINTIVEEVSASDSKNELWFSIYSLSLKVIPILTFAALIILLINLSIILRWAFKKIWKRNASQSAE